MDRYNVLRTIATVRNGSVLLCTDTHTNDQVVVKRIRKLHHTKINEQEKKMPLEKLAHRQVSRAGGHRHVLRLLADFEEDGHDHYVLEYCSHGDLFGLVESAPNRRFDSSRAQDLFGQICDAVMFIHDRGYAHMDLSLENVLIDKYGDVKVSDFGLAVDVDSYQTNAVGKHFYMAPEMLLNTEYEAAKTDVWSLGIMLFIMLTGNPLFERADKGNAVFKYMNQHGLRAVVRAWQLEKFISASAMDLIEKMLTVDPSKRISMEEVVDHEYIREDMEINAIMKLNQRHNETQKRHMATFLMQQVFGTSKKTALFH